MKIQVMKSGIPIPVRIDEHGNPYCPNVCCDAVMEPVGDNQYRCPECAPIGEAIADRLGALAEALLDGEGP